MAATGHLSGAHWHRRTFAVFRKKTLIKGDNSFKKPLFKQPELSKEKLFLTLAFLQYSYEQLQHRQVFKGT